MANAYDNIKDALRITTVAADGSSTSTTAEQRGDNVASIGQAGQSATGGSLVITLPAAGAGLYHYISWLSIVAYATAATAGAATPVTVTQTNLTGGAGVFTIPTAIPIGELREVRVEPARALRSNAANTNTVITCPATTSIIWRVVVYYYVA